MFCTCISDLLRDLRKATLLPYDVLWSDVLPRNGDNSTKDRNVALADDQEEVYEAKAARTRSEKDFENRIPSTLVSR